MNLQFNKKNILEIGLVNLNMNTLYRTYKNKDLQFYHKHDDK